MERCFLSGIFPLPEGGCPLGEAVLWPRHIIEIPCIDSHSVRGGTEVAGDEGPGGVSLYASLSCGQVARYDIHVAFWASEMEASGPAWVDLFPVGGWQGGDRWDGIELSKKCFCDQDSNARYAGRAIASKESNPRGRCPSRTGSLGRVSLLNTNKVVGANELSQVVLFGCLSTYQCVEKGLCVPGGPLVISAEGVVVARRGLWVGVV